MADRTPVIAGIGLSDYPVAPHLDGVQHHAQAMQRALADCGLPKSAIDGYCSAAARPRWSTTRCTMAEYLGIDHRYIDSTMTGGSSFEFHVQHAAAAIRTALCDTVLVTYGSDQLSRMGRMLGTGGFARGGANGRRADGVTRRRYGNSLVGLVRDGAPSATCTSSARRSEQLAEIAVGVREFARLNPQRHVPRPDHRRRRARLAA